MKKRIITTSVAFMAIGTLFSGCGANVSNVYKYPNGKCTKNMPAYVCKNSDRISLSAVSNLSAYGFRHKDYTNSTAAVLQLAAQQTLDSGNRYFAIYLPLEISNFQGDLMNTPKEFMDKCQTTLGDIATMGVTWDKCHLHPRSRFNALMKIAAFKNRPNDVMTYDANEVLAYLKKNEQYDSEQTIKSIN